MKTARLFIAVHVPQKIQNTLLRQMGQLGLTSENIRPVPLSDIHLTLKFIGETDDTHIPPLLEILKVVAERNQSCEITIEGGVLLPPRKPRTFGVRMQHSGQLQDLYEDIDDELSANGLSDRDVRKFYPHITLARTKGLMTPHEISQILSWPCKGMSFIAEDIRLIESTLRPQGPLYTVLTSEPLQ